MLSIILTLLIKTLLESTVNHKGYHEIAKNENKANTDFWIYQRWGQVPRRSKHPL
jgi:hypothetical protein